jgi:hypothetical protein
MQLKYLLFVALFIALQSFNAFAQLTGTKTVGGGGTPDYATIALAISDLNAQGVGPGGVTFNVAAIHTETAPANGYIITATGTSTNTIVFQGNGSTITAGLQTAGTQHDAIFKIVGGDYITIQNFTMQENPGNTVITPIGSQTMTEFGVALFPATATDGAQNNTIRDNVISLSPNYQNAIGILSTSANSYTHGVLSATNTAGTNSNNKFYNNTISDVAYGMYFICPPVTATIYETGIVIGGTSSATGNTITFGNATTANFSNLNRFANTLPAGITFRNGGAGNSVRYNTITSNSLAYGQTNGLGGIITTINAAGDAASSVTYTSTWSDNTITLTNNGTTAITGIDFRYGLSTGTIVSRNNTITLNKTTSATSSTAIIGIKANYASATNTLNRNTITTNQSPTTSGSITNEITGITAAGIGTTVNVDSNSITIKQNVPTGTASYGSGAITYLAVNAASGTVNVNSNNLNTTGSSLRTTGTTHGINHSGAFTTAFSCSYNNINIDRIGASGTFAATYSNVGSSITDYYLSHNIIILNSQSIGSTYGIFNTNGIETRNINNNSISITGSGSTVLGMNITGGTTTNIYSNTISDIVSDGIATGILILTSGTNFNLYNNKIYEITSNGSSGLVSGIRLLYGTNVYIYNNFISHLNAPVRDNADAIRGVSIEYTIASSTIGLYYNTIYLNASSTGTNFGTTGIYHTYSNTATTSALDMRNNIIVNLSTPKGSGRTVAFRRSASTNLNNYSTSSNNNCFYAGTPGVNNLIFLEGTAGHQTILAFQNRVAPRETNSFTENVPFIEVTTPPYDLHIDEATPTYTESGGTPVTTPINIAYDFDDDPRNASTPDVGADEFDGISPNPTPPIITYTPLGGGAFGGSQLLAYVSITDDDGVNITTGKPRVYYKKSTHDNDWVDNTNSTNGWKWVETTDGGPEFDFTIDYSKLFGGVGVSVGDEIQYFVVAQDEYTVPNVGINSGTFSNPPASSVNLSSEDFPIGGTINSYTIFNQIIGEITVGSGGDYASLTENSADGLFKTLNESLIAGDITIKITSDIFESGAVALDETTEEANYSITIQPNDDSPKTISGNYAGGLIRLNGADNVTFDGRVGGSGRYLTFKNTSTSSSAVFHIISQGTNAGATDNTIRNCIIEAGANTNGIFGIFAGSSTLGLAGNDNDNLSIIDNIVSKSYSAIEVIATESGVNDNIVITGNIIGSEFSGSYIGKYGIAVQRASGADISGNTVFNVISATDNTIGIRSHFTTSTTIAGNLIHSISYTGPSFNGGMGIDINNAGNHSSNLTIANNVIYDISGTGFSGGDQAIQGIRIQNNQGGINIYYNSINLYGSISRSAATVDKSFSIFIGTGVTNLDIRDNIFANSINNTSGVATAYAIYCESAASAFTDINHNDYFASGPEGVLGFLGSNRTLLAQWQGATGKDGNSIASDPLFNSNENLRPQAGSPVLGAGTPIGGITTDFLGVTRGNPPSIGAYEEAGDFGAPVIVYTPLTNTFLTENRTLSNVLITDATGVDWTANKPRIYYKKATDNNVFGGNTSTDNGWKWTEANTSLSPTNFTIDYSIIFGGSVSQGQTIQYFVVAQDISDPPLVGSNPSVGFVGSSVSSITSAPVSPNQYIIQSGPMSGDYTVGSTGTYATLTLAVQDLNMRGVGGPVKLLLNDAAYSSETFPVVIDVEDNLPTETNTVTIKPNTGVTASISGSSSTQIIKILNSFVSIDGSNTSEGTSRDLTIENSNTDDFNRSVTLIGSKGNHGNN